MQAALVLLSAAQIVMTDRSSTLAKGIFSLTPITEPQTGIHAQVDLMSGNKIKEFVNVIKQGLRYNNDDYSESSISSVNMTQPQFTRSAIIYSVSRTPLSTTPKPVHFYYTKGNNQPNKIVDTNARRLLLLKEPTTEQTAGATTQLSYSQTAQTKARKKAGSKFPKLKSLMTHKVTRKTGRKLRALHSADNRDPDYHQFNLPKEEQLDMAPAIGRHIHRMRLEGRLCQRSVLLPEGPKYNSLGKIYMPAYEVHRRKDFSITFPPKAILPRCCNCCRKSMLGCD